MSRTVKVLLAVVAVAVVVAAVVVGFVLGRGGDDAGSASAPTATPPAGGGDVHGGESGPIEYQIEAGSGGSATAEADGETPVGYDSSCAGAVQAATNYLTWVIEPAVQWRVDEQTYDALVDEVNGNLDGGIGPISEMKQRVKENGFFEPGGEEDHFRSTPHPEWGAFRVVECTDSSLATVEIMHGGTFNHTPDKAVFVSNTIYLAWHDGDWRLIDVTNDEGIDIDGHLPTETPVDGVRQWRANFLEFAGPAWMEYTNAPR